MSENRIIPCRECRHLHATECRHPNPRTIKEIHTNYLSGHTHTEYHSAQAMRNTFGGCGHDAEWFEAKKPLPEPISMYERRYRAYIDQGKTIPQAIDEVWKDFSAAELINDLGIMEDAVFMEIVEEKVEEYIRECWSHYKSEEVSDE